MIIGVGFEKRDWGGGKATWRQKPKRRPRTASGPSQYAIRLASNKRAKRLMFVGESLKCY